MEKRLTVALVAHDAMKHDLAEWVAWNWEKLLAHRLICTGTTGRIVADTLMERRGKGAQIHASILRCLSQVLWVAINS